METFGHLKIKMFIAFSQDEHGRLDGRWRTIYSKWTERENVEQLLETFAQANPAICSAFNQLHVAFETSENIRI